MNRKFTVAFVVWTFFVLLASLIPGKALPRTDWLSLAQLDKLVHLCLYFIMYILMYASLIREFSVKWKKGLLIIACAIFAIGYGFLMEILQANLNTGRYFDIFDVLANTIGVVLAVLIVLLKHKN